MQDNVFIKSLQHHPSRFEIQFATSGSAFKPLIIRVKNPSLLSYYYKHLQL